ncbi:hypothetical protein [Methylovorus glucosotrophus]|uniref:Uncharacterized protein n=1 Tax=Methylovorus glucosotrophus (strain SIP3-4) TaxID=582744 RepID=C6X7W7_METGS|nr:hypothetical protein [Methylovorus glucosotrophus]ACT51294.1 hypothetical protein Msip34_2052 [Methylovorus glucosotrophus SIP3-4]
MRVQKIIFEAEDLSERIIPNRCMLNTQQGEEFKKATMLLKDENDTITIDSDVVIDSEDIKSWGNPVWVQYLINKNVLKFNGFSNSPAFSAVESKEEQMELMKSRSDDDKNARSLMIHFLLRNNKISEPNKTGKTRHPSYLEMMGHYKHK